MIRKLLKRTERFLGSARLALVLFAFVGVWSMLATMIPQGIATARTVMEWDAARGWLGDVLGFVGLHQAFMAPAFIVASVLLAVSTAVCCWGRTHAALVRSRLLVAGRATGVDALTARHDLSLPIPCEIDEADALNAAREAFGGLGLRMRESGGVLRSVSAPWSVWGSPVFHWSLLLLMLAALSGVLLRSEGLMAIEVGGSRADAPKSYLSLNAGALHDWSRVHRSIRVDAFDPALMKDGIDRGAVPTVSVLDASGTPIVTQQVYPNMKLHAGALSINAPGCGLVVTLAILDSAGTEMTRVTQFVDFSQEASGGTVPQRVMAVRNNQGQIVLKLYATVPLDRAKSGGYGEWIPRDPAARVVMTEGDGKVIVDEVVRKGAAATVAGEGSIKVLDIGWYSLLSLVDDPTIPFVYGAMILASLGLTLSVAMPQRLVVAAVIGEGAERSLAVNLRLWRNNPTSRREVEEALVAALDAGRAAPLEEKVPDEGEVEG